MYFYAISNEFMDKLQNPCRPAQLDSAPLHLADGIRRI